MTTCILVILQCLNCFSFVDVLKQKLDKTISQPPIHKKQTKQEDQQSTTPPPKGNWYTKMYVFFKCFFNYSMLLSAYFHIAIWWCQPAFIKTLQCITFNYRPWIITYSKNLFYYLYPYAQTSSVNCGPIVVKGKINKSHHISTTILLFLVMWGMEELHLYKFPWG